MRITLIQIGKTKQDFWRAAEAEYAKRLAAFAKLEVVTLKEEQTKSSKTEDRGAVMEKEGEKILEKIPSRSFVIALTEEGKTSSSRELAQKIERIRTNPGAVTFIIGGCFGLSDAVKQKADLILSLSPLTFTHEMARVVLLEQVYRAFTILNNQSYHY